MEKHWQNACISTYTDLHTNYIAMYAIEKLKTKATDTVQFGF